MAEWIEYLSADPRFPEAAAACGVHPLALEDCLHRDQRPKLDDYESHQLLVWFALAGGRLHELQFLIFPSRIVAVPHEAPPSGATWREFLRLGDQPRDVWHLLYQALDRATDVTWQELREIFSEIDGLEQEMFDGRFDPRALLALKKRLRQVDYLIGQMPSVAHQVQNLCRPKDDLKWKFRDLIDHCERLYQTIIVYRSQVGSTIDLYWGLQANRTNEQIKKLSLMASVAVPLTFWASFWGMNFQKIPFERGDLFAVALAVMALSVGGTVWFLARRGYWSG